MNRVSRTLATLLGSAMLASPTAAQSAAKIAAQCTEPATFAMELDRHGKDGAITEHWDLVDHDGNRVADPGKVIRYTPGEKFTLHTTNGDGKFTGPHVYRDTTFMIGDKKTRQYVLSTKGFEGKAFYEVGDAKRACAMQPWEVHFEPYAAAKNLAKPAVAVSKPAPKQVAPAPKPAAPTKKAAHTEHPSTVNITINYFAPTVPAQVPYTAPKPTPYTAPDTTHKAPAPAPGKKKTYSLADTTHHVATKDTTHAAKKLKAPHIFTDTNRVDGTYESIGISYQLADDDAKRNIGQKSERTYAQRFVGTHADARYLMRNNNWIVDAKADYNTLVGNQKTESTIPGVFQNTHLSATSFGASLDATRRKESALAPTAGIYGRKTWANEEGKNTTGQPYHSGITQTVVGARVGTDYRHGRFDVAGTVGAEKRWHGSVENLFPVTEGHARVLDLFGPKGFAAELGARYGSNKEYSEQSMTLDLTGHIGPAAIYAGVERGHTTQNRANKESIMQYRIGGSFALPNFLYK